MILQTAIAALVAAHVVLLVVTYRVILRRSSVGRVPGAAVVRGARWVAMTPMGIGNLGTRLPAAVGALALTMTVAMCLCCASMLGLLVYAAVAA